MSNRGRIVKFRHVKPMPKRVLVELRLDHLLEQPAGNDASLFTFSVVENGHHDLLKSLTVE